MYQKKSLRRPPVTISNNLSCVQKMKDKKRWNFLQNVFPRRVLAHVTLDKRECPVLVSPLRVSPYLSESETVLAYGVNCKGQSNPMELVPT